jgi:hypothetical protein
LNETRVLSRLNSANIALHPYKQKIHKLRRVAAGDHSLITEAPSRSRDASSGIVRPLETENFDILVQDIEEGKSNKMLQSLRTLALQTAYFFPEIEFEDLSPEESALAAQYCRIRMGAPPHGCNAKHHMRLALMEYILGGMGAVWTTMRDGLPVIQYVDTLDFKWDQTARFPQDMRWASCSVREPLWVWIERFGRAPFKGFMAANGTNEDLPVELEYYFDVEGEKGNMFVMLKTGVGELDEKPIFKGPNPYVMPTPAGQNPFLPFETFFFLALPSVRLPVGLAEQMLPSHIALLRVEDFIDKIIKRGPPFYEVEKGSFESEELDKFEDGEIGTYLIREPGKSPVIQQRALEIPNSVLGWRSHHQDQMTAQSGANPYTSGTRVDDIQYAAEVHAINNNSSLVSGTIAKDNAEFWERTIRKYLATAALYDDNPVTLILSGVPIEFDSLDPVSTYLRPEARIIIREDSMRFSPTAERVAQAMQDLQVALQVAEVFPSALPHALENYLRARGEKHIGKWLEAAPQQQGAAPEQTMIEQML